MEVRESGERQSGGFPSHSYAGGGLAVCEGSTSFSQRRLQFARLFATFPLPKEVGLFLWFNQGGFVQPGCSLCHILFTAVIWKPPSPLNSAYRLNNYTEIEIWAGKPKHAVLSGHLICLAVSFIFFLVVCFLQTLPKKLFFVFIGISPHWTWRQQPLRAFILMEDDVERVAADGTR